MTTTDGVAVIEASLILLIGGEPYELRRMPSELSEHRLIWELQREGSEPHTVIVFKAQGRLDCDCGDYTWRKERVGGLCKHLAALVEAGLVPHKDKVWSKVP